jgi:hypothetical protein
MRQEQHHGTRTFKEELEELCSELGIDINDPGLL